MQETNKAAILFLGLNLSEKGKLMASPYSGCPSICQEEKMQEIQDFLNGDRLNRKNILHQFFCEWG